MGGTEVAKKTVRRTASNAEPEQTSTRRKPVDIPALRTMLERLQDEMQEIERRDGPNRKTVRLLLRINDLLQLLRCQENMTSP
jgi:hypothetical protein